MLFFEKDLEIYVSSVNTGFTTSNTVKLAILKGLSIDYKEKRESTYNYKMEATPDRTDRKVVTGYTNPKIKFSTYAKPYNDTTNDTCVEKILLSSLMGQEGTDGVSSFVATFAATHQLPEIYIYIVSGNLVYYVENAVVQQAEYKIKMNEYTTINWSIIGREFSRVETTDLPDTYTDYSDIAEYVKSNFSTFNFTYDASALFEPDMVYLDGTDYVNKGSEATSIITTGENTIETIGGSTAYDFGDNNASTAKLEIQGPTWTGNAYPNDGVGNFAVEAYVYWDGSNPGTQQYFFTLTNNSTNRIYTQSNLFLGGMFTRTMYPGNYSPLSSISFAEAGLVANTWTHLMWMYNAANQTGHFFVDGKPVTTLWTYDSVNGDPGVGSSGITVGNHVTDPWYYGGMKHVAVNWGGDLPYEINYTDMTTPVIGSTVAKVSTDFADDGPNNYTVTNFSCIDQGTYLDSPESSAAYFTIDRGPDWDAPDWSISIRIYYGRSGGTYAAGTFFDDGVRRMRLLSNGLLCEINGSVVCVDQSVGPTYYTDSFPKDTWMYLCFERKDGIYLLYINGILRAANGKRNIIPNTIPSTGAATVINFEAGYRCAMQNLRIDNAAVFTNWITPKYSTTTVNGSLPIVDATVKMANTVKIVERDTLDNRLISKLDHYVENRKVEVNMTGYLKTGKNATTVVGPLDLYDLQKQYPGFSQLVDLNSTLRIGQDTQNKIEFNLPKADIYLPEIKPKDIISSNIKVTSQTKDTANDDMTLTYYEQDLPSNIFTPEGVPNLLIDDAYINYIYGDGAKHIYPMQEESGTALYDIVGGNNGVITNYTDNLLYSQTGKPVGGSTLAPNCLLQNNNNAFAVCSVPLSTYIAANGGVSLEVWWKYTSFNSTSPQIFGIGNTGVSNQCLVARRDGAGTNICLSDLSDITDTPTFVPSTSTWYHIVITTNGTNDHKLYVNGVLRFTATWSVTSIANEVTFLGARDRADVNNMIQYQSHGAVYDRILTGTEVLAHYNQG